MLLLLLLLLLFVFAAWDPTAAFLNILHTHTHIDVMHDVSGVKISSLQHQVKAARDDDKSRQQGSCD